MNASRQSFPVSALICTLMAALFAARYLLAPYPFETPFEGGMPLAAALTRFTVARPWLAATVAAAILIWTLLSVVQLTVKYAPAASRNYLPAQILLVCIGGVVVPGEALAAFAAVWLFTLASRQLVFSFQKGYRFRELFHAGFYLGAIPLLYAPATAIVPAIAVSALAIYRRSGREAVVCLAGLLLPVPAAGFIYWAFGTPFDHIYRELWRSATRPSTEAFFTAPIPVSLLVIAAGVLAITLTGVFWTLTHKKSIRKTQYKFMQHTSFALLLLAFSALIPGTSSTITALAALPCALSVPYSFSGKVTAVSTSLYCFILTAVLVMDLLPVFGVRIPLIDIFPPYTPSIF